MFHILGEVGYLEKGTIQDPSTLCEVREGLET